MRKILKRVKLKKAVCSFMAAVMIISLSACGEAVVTENESNVENATEQNNPAEENNEGENNQAAEEVSGNVNDDLETALGEWVMIAYKSDGYTSIADDNYMDGEANVYIEDGKYLIDWLLLTEGSTEIYGRKIEPQSGAMYGNCQNQSWYADFYKKDREASSTDMKFTLTDSNSAEVLSTYTYYSKDDLGNDTKEVYNTLYYLKRKGVDYSQDIFEFRYPETYEVSNIYELYDALGSNRRIILKEGTYNFSDLGDNYSYNGDVNWRENYDLYGDYEQHYEQNEGAYMAYANNLLIEGEEGADVHICTNCEWLAPLQFYGGYYITLKNLRIGHNAEKGTCAGAVVSFDYSSNITVENCRLYGCGTYGINAENTGEIKVIDTEIYECSYGITYMTDCYNVLFDNCIMRDSVEYSMFDFIWCSSIAIDNCIIKNNRSMNEGYAFIRAVEGYGTTIFTNCTFENNEYLTFTEGNVVIQ